MDKKDQRSFGESHDPCLIYCIYHIIYHSVLDLIALRICLCRAYRAGNTLEASVSLCVCVGVCVSGGRNSLQDLVAGSRFSRTIRFEMLLQGPLMLLLLLRLMASQEIPIGSSVLGTHEHIDQWVYAGRQVDQQIAHHIEDVHIVGTLPDLGHRNG